MLYSSLARATFRNDAARMNLFVDADIRTYSEDFDMIESAT